MGSLFVSSRASVWINSPRIGVVGSWEGELHRAPFISLAPGRLKWNISWGIFKSNLVINGLGVSREIALRSMSQDLTDDKSTLVQVMAWCRQATSHYLSQCWPRSMSPYGVTRPQWVILHLTFYLKPIHQGIMGSFSNIKTVLPGVGFPL